MNQFLPPIECISCCSQYISVITSSASNELFLLIYRWKEDDISNCIMSATGKPTFSAMSTMDEAILKESIGQRESRSRSSLKKLIMLDTHSEILEDSDILTVMIAINNLQSQKCETNTSVLKSWQLRISHNQHIINVDRLQYRDSSIHRIIDCIVIHKSNCILTSCESKSHITFRDSSLNLINEICYNTSNDNVMQFNSPPSILTLLNSTMVCLVLDPSQILIFCTERLVLLLQFNLSNSSISSVSSDSVVSVLAIDTGGTEGGSNESNIKINNRYSKSLPPMYSIIFGTSDGKLRLFKIMSVGSDSVWTHNDCGCIDIVKDLRFQQGDNVHVHTAPSSQISPDRFKLPNKKTTGATSSPNVQTPAVSISLNPLKVKHEKTSVPIAMCYEDGRQRMNGMNASEEVSASADTTGIVYLVTSSSLIAIDFETFKIKNSWALATKDHSLSSVFCASISTFNMELRSPSQKKIFSPDFKITNFINAGILNAFDRLGMKCCIANSLINNIVTKENSAKKSSDIVSYQDVDKLISNHDVYRNANDRSYISPEQKRISQSYGKNNLQSFSNDSNIQNMSESLENISIVSPNNENQHIVDRLSLDASASLSLFLTADTVIDECSPLASELAVPPTPLTQRGASALATPLSKGSWESPSKDKQGKIQDLPVTFHSRIKSSGYGQTPQDSYAKKKANVQKLQQKLNKTLEKEKLARSMSAPRTTAIRVADNSGGPSSAAQRPALSREKTKNELLLLRTTKGPIVGARIRSYPTDCQPMTLHQNHNQFSLGVPIQKVTFNEDASLMGFVASDASVSVLKMPVNRNKGDGFFYMGHDARLTDLCFSHHEKNMLITSSVDGTARIWKGAKVDTSAVLFTHFKHQPSGGFVGAMTSTTGGDTFSSQSQSVKSSKSSERNKPFGQEVLFSKFYYMDKFAVLGLKSSVLLYIYKPEASDAKNDIKRLQSAGKYQQVYSWNTSSSSQLGAAGNITALACINSVHSPVLFAASSDRKLHVLDAATGKFSRQIDSPHERSIHCIALPQPSMHIQVSRDAYNIFATSAIDGVITLWDLRAPRCMSRFSSHVNRRESIQVSFSPCLRWLGTGSEDKTARIIDLRGGKEIIKLIGHKDVVTDVVFNPLFPQLATCSYDGTVRYYIDPLADEQSFIGI